MKFRSFLSPESYLRLTHSLISFLTLVREQHAGVGSVSCADVTLQSELWWIFQSKKKSLQLFEGWRKWKCDSVKPEGCLDLLTVVECHEARYNIITIIIIIMSHPVTFKSCNAHVYQAVHELSRLLFVIKPPNNECDSDQHHLSDESEPSLCCAAAEIII